MNKNPTEENAEENLRKIADPTLKTDEEIAEETEMQIRRILLGK